MQQADRSAASPTLDRGAASALGGSFFNSSSPSRFPATPDPENIERARADIAVARAKHAEARAERAEAAVKLASEETERMRRAVEEFVARKEVEAQAEQEAQKDADFKVPEFIAQGEKRTTLLQIYHGCVLSPPLSLFVWLFFP